MTGDGFDLAALLENEVFVGMVGMSVALSLLYTLRSLPGKLLAAGKFLFTTHVTVTNDSSVFPWLCEWFAQSDHMQRSRRLRLVEKPMTERRGPGGLDNDQATWALIASKGKHVFWRGGMPFVYEHEIDTNASKGKDLTESVSITTLGRNRAPILRIIDEARALMVDQNDRIPVFVWKGWWHKIDNKKIRDLATVVADREVKSALVDDLEWFYRHRDWYERRGIPYRRGYLLSGPPGTGKTSLITALAGVFERPLFIVNLAAVRGDDDLLDAFWSVPPRGILVMEDIDAAQRDRTAPAQRSRGDASDGAAESEEEEKGISLSGLLNVLDGIVAPDGRVVMMTTNHPDRLDPALIRPGRTDKHIELRAFDGELAQAMFRLFYQTEPPPVAGSIGLTGAEMQQLFMENPDPALAAQALRRAGARSLNGSEHGIAP